MLRNFQTPTKSYSGKIQCAWPHVHGSGCLCSMEVVDDEFKHPNIVKAEQNVITPEDISLVGEKQETVVRVVQHTRQEIQIPIISGNIPPDCDTVGVNIYIQHDIEPILWYKHEGQWYKFLNSTPKQVVEYKKAVVEYPNDINCSGTHISLGKRTAMGYTDGTDNICIGDNSSFLASTNGKVSSAINIGGGIEYRPSTNHINLGCNQDVSYIAGHIINKKSIIIGNVNSSVITTSDILSGIYLIKSNITLPSVLDLYNILPDIHIGHSLSLIVANHSDNEYRIYSSDGIKLVDSLEYIKITPQSTRMLSVVCDSILPLSFIIV